MTPPTFRIGDEVVIIGPTVAGHSDFTGHKFKIDCECHGTYAGEGYPWYPAGSLRLVEELKIGDWVQHDGIVFQIADISSGEPYYLHRSGKTFEKWYHPSALRKLAPDEIPHQGQFTTEQRLASLEEYAKENDARVSAIEKRQDEAREYSDDLEKITETLANRIYDLQKRVDFLEAFQKDTTPFAIDNTKSYAENLMAGLRAMHRGIPNCKPNGREIKITIDHGAESLSKSSTLPCEILNFVVMALDSLREDET